MSFSKVLWCFSYRTWTFLIKFILRYFIVWVSHCAWDTFLITFLNGYCWVYGRGVKADAMLSPAMLMNSLFRLVFFLRIRRTLNEPCLSHWGWAFLKSKRLCVPRWQLVERTDPVGLQWGLLCEQGFLADGLYSPSNSELSQAHNSGCYVPLHTLSPQLHDNQGQVPLPPFPLPCTCLISTYQALCQMPERWEGDIEVMVAGINASHSWESDSVN